MKINEVIQFEDNRRSRRMAALDKDGEAAGIEEFFEIVANAPRGVQYVFNSDQAKVTSLLTDFFRTQNKEALDKLDDIVPAEQIKEAGELYTLFSDGKARLINYQYGRNIESKEQQAVQLKNGI